MCTDIHIHRQHILIITLASTSLVYFVIVCTYKLWVCDFVGIENKKSITTAAQQPRKQRRMDENKIKLNMNLHGQQ